jgi:hypothetical protein
MARLTNIRISQHTPWGSTLPKRKNRKKMKGRTREKWNNDHPLELNIPKCDQPKHPKIPKETSLKANQDPRIWTDGLTETHGPGWQSEVS